MAAIAQSTAKDVAEAVASAPEGSGPANPLPASACDLAAWLNPITPDALANGFATLVGALLGAMLAYVLQRKLQETRERRASLMAGHRLMFSLLQQINTIVLIQRDHVYGELKNRGHFITIPALPPFDIKKNVLELSELSFLLADSEARKLLYDFYIAQENYVEALNQWNLRSQFHLERLQPALAASGIPNGSEVTDDDMKRALGDQVYSHAINATDNCILTLRRAFTKLAPLKDAVRPYLVRRFGTKDFTDFELADTWGLTEP